MNKLVFFFSTMLLIGTAQAQESDNTENTSESAEHARGEHLHHRRGGRGKMHKLMLEEVDANKDGQIDLNEFLAHAESRFQKMDLNADGYVTKEEGREAGKQMRIKMKEKRAEMRKKHRESRESEVEQDNDQ